MVSVGVYRMGKTRVVFIDPGAKVNSSYYCNIVLEEGLLPDIRAICRHYRWTLQQDEEERRRNFFATNNNNIKQEKHNIKVSS